MGGGHFLAKTEFKSCNKQTFDFTFSIFLNFIVVYLGMVGEPSPMVNKQAIEKLINNISFQIKISHNV